MSCSCCCDTDFFWFQTFEKKKKKALVDALEKIKTGKKERTKKKDSIKLVFPCIYCSDNKCFSCTELMVLGFISLLLTFGQNYISKVCITEKIANTMLPCPMIKKHAAPAAEHSSPEKDNGDDHHRRLLWHDHRFLSADSPAAECPKVR